MEREQLRKKAFYAEDSTNGAQAYSARGVSLSKFTENKKVADSGSFTYKNKITAKDDFTTKNTVSATGIKGELAKPSNIKYYDSLQTFDTSTE